MIYGKKESAKIRQQPDELPRLTANTLAHKIFGKAFSEVHDHGRPLEHG
jgi:hypothetical protein